MLFAGPLTFTSSSRPPPRCLMCAFRESDADNPGVGVVLTLYVSLRLLRNEDIQSHRLVLDLLTHSRAFLVSGVFNDEDRPDKPSIAADSTRSVLSWFGLTTEKRAASGSTPGTPAVLRPDSGIVSMACRPEFMMASMGLSSTRGRRFGGVFGFDVARDNSGGILEAGC